MSDKETETGVGKAVLYMSADERLDNKIVLSILKSPNSAKISSIPPYRPKGGDVYLISHTDNTSKANDWSCDWYRWINKGGYGISKNEPYILARRYNLSQHKGDQKGTDAFQRRVYLDKNIGLTLVHYIGDQSLYNSRPHGNDKSENPSEYRRTMPSVLYALKKQTKTQTAGTVFKQMSTNGVPGIYQGEMNPRNLRQVKHQRDQSNKSNRISHDELYSTLQLAYHLEGIIHDITIYPDMNVILAHPDILTELNKVLLVKSDEPLLLSYDTTFNLGDFYVSVLVFKHILFQDGLTIPLGFLKN